MKSFYHVTAFIVFLFQLPNHVCRVEQEIAKGVGYGQLKVRIKKCVTTSLVTKGHLSVLPRLFFNLQSCCCLLWNSYSLTM